MDSQEQRFWVFCHFTSRGAYDLMYNLDVRAVGDVSTIDTTNDIHKLSFIR